MNILRRAGYRRMPWKNGQGLTEEVAACPQGCTVETFDWRISIAHVGSDGPFSAFPGVDRSIALLDGDGLRLDLPGDKSTLLTPGGEPFAFPGEWAVSSRNGGGDTIDLNIMTRRGRCAHRLRRHRASGALAFSWACDVAILANDDCRVRHDDIETALMRFDAVMVSPGERIVLHGDRLDILAAEFRMAL